MPPSCRTPSTFSHAVLARITCRFARQCIVFRDLFKIAMYSSTAAPKSFIRVSTGINPRRNALC